jgi:hypothetical protein
MVQKKLTCKHEISVSCYISLFCCGKKSGVAFTRNYRSAEAPGTWAWAGSSIVWRNNLGPCHGHRDPKHVVFVRLRFSGRSRRQCWCSGLQRHLQPWRWSQYVSPKGLQLLATQRGVSNLPYSEAAWPKAFGRLNIGITGSNPAWVMDICPHFLFIVL